MLSVARSRRSASSFDESGVKASAAEKAASCSFGKLKPSRATSGFITLSGRRGG